MIGVCCLHGLFAHRVYTGMHLSSYLFIIPVPSSLHLSYLNHSVGFHFLCTGRLKQCIFLSALL